MANWADIRSTIQNWAEAELSPKLAIWADQNAPRPRDLYATLKIISGPTVEGVDERRMSTTTPGEITVVGVRRITVSVNVYAVNKQDATADPLAVAEKLQLSLSKQSHMDNLQVKGLAARSVGPVRDVTAVIGDGFEKRANFDVEFGFQSTVTENVGWIETVISEGTFHSGTRTKVVNSQI